MRILDGETKVGNDSVLIVAEKAPFINKKNKKTYWQLKGKINDATNRYPNKRVSLYMDPETQEFYIRDSEEFIEKFEEIQKNTEEKTE